MNTIQAKQIQIVDYLESLGYFPSQKSGSDYWYHSMLPGRKDNTPSFKVDTQKNLWKDWGAPSKTGGTLIDFGTTYHQCSISDFLNILETGRSFKIHQPALKNEATDKKEIVITRVKEFDSFILLRYAESRRIPQHILRHYCNEVHYQMNDKNYFAIGFKNDAGGYALRNQVIKAASKPNGPTFIDNNADTVAVFEGFFNFLSYKVITEKQDMKNENYLILNSTSFAEQSLPILQRHIESHLYLDNDKTGDLTTLFLKERNPNKCLDERLLYKEYKDLNAYHLEFGKPRQQQRL